MPNDNAETLLKRIGEQLAEDTEYPLDNTLLHAEVARNFVAPSIFKDLGSHILYRDPDLDRLGDTLLALWEAQTAEPRWQEIEYFVRDGRFDARFVYPEELDPEEMSLDRRDRVLARYFGDKPVIYPDPDDEDDIFEL